MIGFSDTPYLNDVSTIRPFHSPRHFDDNLSRPLILEPVARQSTLSMPGGIGDLWTGAERKPWGGFRARLPEPEVTISAIQPPSFVALPEQRRATWLVERLYAGVSERVGAYLVRYPGVLALLPDVARQVEAYFHADPRRRLGLEVLDDPDTDQAELFVIIQSSLAADQAESCLDRLLEDWFVDQSVVRASRLAMVVEPLTADG